MRGELTEIKLFMHKEDGIGFPRAEDRHVAPLEGGESLHEIGRAFGTGHGSIRFLLTQRGGMVPATRRRSLRTLTLAEREDISRGIASGSSIREIAKGLQRAASTVSREVARNGGGQLYRANEADHQAWESARDPRCAFLPSTRSCGPSLPVN